MKKRAEIVVPKTRAKITTILGAISAAGIISIKVRLPKAPIQRKKRKMAGDKSSIKRGTVTGHYF